MPLFMKVDDLNCGQSIAYGLFIAAIINAT